MTQFIISAIGSYGDVHPMVGLGAALAAPRPPGEADHQSVFCRRGRRRRGWNCCRSARARNTSSCRSIPDLWHPIRGAKLVLSQAAGGFLRPIYELVTEHYVPGETVLCAHALDLGSRVAAEKLRAPLAVRRFRAGHDLERLRFAAVQGCADRAARAEVAEAVAVLGVGHAVRAAAVGDAAQRLAARAGPAAGEARVRRNGCIERTWCSGCFPIGSVRRNPIGRRTRGWSVFRCGMRTRTAELSREVQDFLAAGDAADRVFARLGQPRGASVLRGGRRGVRADWAGAASCSPNTTSNCRPSCRDRCGISASCR